MKKFSGDDPDDITIPSPVKEEGTQKKPENEEEKDTEDQERLKQDLIGVMLTSKVRSICFQFYLEINRAYFKVAK